MSVEDGGWRIEGTNNRGIVGIGLTHRFGINGHGELKNQVSRLDTRDLHSGRKEHGDRRRGDRSSTGKQKMTINAIMNSDATIFTTMPIGSFIQK